MIPGEEKIPLVTVAMVTYNSSPYIKVAIDSVLCSSYRNFELLIVDDRSTDNTWDIVGSYQDSRIRAIRNEKNLGEYPNRDQCARLAAGEYFIFIDGDDIIYPHGLEFMVRMLHAFPDCAMALMCWFRSYIVFPAVITSRQFYIGEYFGHGFLGTAFSNVLFRTEILRKEDGLVSEYRSGDNYIRYKIATRYNSLLINDGLTWWRETPGQASQVLERSGKLFIESYKLKFDFLKRETCPLSKEEKKIAADNLYVILARLAWRSLLKSDIKKIGQIFGKLKVPPRYLLNCFRRPVEINPFAGHTAANPYMAAFEKNPFSKCSKT